MKKIILILLLPLFSLGQQKDYSAVEICSLIQEYSSFSSSTQADYALDKIMAVTGLKTNFVLRPCENISNALAATVNGKRFILYDPNFMKSLNQGNQYWSNLFILAHEVAHHLNNHTIDWMILKNNNDIPNRTLEQQRKYELEADEFAGFILAKLGASFLETTDVITKLPDIKVETTHPFPSRRLAAVKKGFDRGKLEFVKSSNINAEIEDVSRVYDNWKKTLEYPRAKFNANSSGNPFLSKEKEEDIPEVIEKIWVSGFKIDGNKLLSEKPIIEFVKSDNKNTVFLKNFGIKELILDLVNNPKSNMQKIIFGNPSLGSLPRYFGIKYFLNEANGNYYSKDYYNKIINHNIDGFYLSRMLNALNISDKSALGILNAENGKRVSEIILDMINSYGVGSKKLILNNSDSFRNSENQQIGNVTLVKDWKNPVGFEWRYGSNGNNPNLKDLSISYCPEEMGCKIAHLIIAEDGHNQFNLNTRSFEDLYGISNVEIPSHRTILYHLSAYDNNGYKCEFGFDIEFEILVGNEKITTNHFLKMEDFLNFFNSETDIWETNDFGYFKRYKRQNPRNFRMENQYEKLYVLSRYSGRGVANYYYNDAIFSYDDFSPSGRNTDYDGETLGIPNTWLHTYRDNGKLNWLLNPKEISDYRKKGNRGLIRSTHPGTIYNVLNVISEKNENLRDSKFFIRISKISVVFFGQSGVFDGFGNPNNKGGGINKTKTPPGYRNIYTISNDLSQSSVYYEFSLKGFQDSKN